jgi:hypothetical protein
MDPLVGSESKCFHIYEYSRTQYVGTVTSNERILSAPDADNVRYVRSADGMSPWRR